MGRTACILAVGFWLAVAPKVVAGEAASSPAPVGLRLPRTARPLHYDLDLTIVPEEDAFRGTIEADVELREATSLLWLNAKKLTIDSAELRTAGGTAATATVRGGDEFVGLDFGDRVGPGRARLRVTYRGAYFTTDTHGLFKQKEGGDWYVYSQFEATHARKAFPCFDEPEYKVPWRLTLHVKGDQVAVSNTRVVEETAEANGMKAVRFAQTKPLPSYLVALAVGPFDVLDGGVVGKRRTPLHCYTPRGRAAEARYAAETTLEIFNRLEAYFDIPYPYDKLDLVTIPETVAFGAMENAGMITCNQTRLLNGPEDLTVEQRRGLAGLIAHEVAHQWFGDLVTMEYWDDVWLNESFASWMGSKVLDQWKPEWEGDMRRLGSRARAMAEDVLVTARKIRQPIETQDDIENAFDSITYAKGATVLAMFEAWMGPERFQKGVQEYLRAHAFSSATGRDFVDALSDVGGPEAGAAFSTFLDQAGVPLVTAELRCAASAPARLVLSQKRLLPTGSRGSSEQLFGVPVCFRYGSGEVQDRRCVLLQERSAEIPLGASAGCPEWLLANEGERGYYVVSYGGDLSGRLLADRGGRLALAERVGLLDDVRALVRAGLFSMGEALSLVPSLAEDPSRHIVGHAARIVADLEDDLVPDESRPNYARFVRRMFGKHARELGFTGRPDEDDDTKLLRNDLVLLVARSGEDKILRKEAGRLARQWLVDRKAVSADMAQDVLSIAALDGDRALFERYRAQAKKTSDRKDRRRMLAAMGSFLDPEVLKAALALTLGDEFDVRESSRILRSGLDDFRARQIVYDFVKQNFEALTSRMPSESGAFLFTLGGAFCDEAHRDDAERFFQPRVNRFPGAPRNLDQALEAITLCAANRRAQRSAVLKLLQAY